ncbi:HAMP domain-containing histidine kinase [soil metagenome]
MLSERLRFRDIRNTSTFRLTALLGLLFALGVALLLGLIYILTVRELSVRSDHVIRQTSARLMAKDPAALPRQIDAEIARGTLGMNYFALLSASGERVAGNFEPPAPLRDDRLTDIAAAEPVHGPLRLLATRTRSGETIVVGRYISPILDLRARVLDILIGSGVAIGLSMLTAAVALSLRTLHRVRDLQRASQEITAGRLSARMPIAGRGDELDLFAGTVNVIIEEVGRVVAQVKGVTDAIAHDLRTPLTHVRTALRRMQQLPDIDPDAAALAASAIGDLDLVLERFAALLRIAELEASGRRTGFAQLDLTALAARVGELYEPLAEEREIALRITGDAPAIVEGDAQLLFEAISNLLDNAIKFTPFGGAVTVRVLAEPAPAIEVRDTGPGIAPDQRQAVLRRFHRGVDTAAIPGSGLGLSVVAAIVHLHHFQLELADANPGLRATIRCATL